ncbi:MAG: hypothetical protein ACLVK4_14420 [Alistipes shahii]|uniref:hypothetical protein n=1 Tax=Alistipes shahii TaxID=328814 RepID=UPI00399D0C28
MKKFLPEAGFSGRVMRRLAVLLVIWTAGLSAAIQRSSRSRRSDGSTSRNATVQAGLFALAGRTGDVQYDFAHSQFGRSMPPPSAFRCK